MSVEECIQSIVDEIDKNPFIFHTEADIHARLYNKLCRKLDENEPKHTTKFKGLKTNLVHLEYFGGNRRRIDIVIFDRYDVKKINKNSMEIKKSGNYVKLSDIIEIKAFEGNLGKKIRWSQAQADIDKLKNLSGQNKEIEAHFVYIVRWPTIDENARKDIRELIKHLEDSCKNEKIRFYCNKNHFLDIS